MQADRLLGTELTDADGNVEGVYNTDVIFFTLHAPVPGIICS
jgi:hypothetical protein